MHRENSLYSTVFKRLVDFTISLLALIILLPIILLVSILLMYDLKGNPFFTQLRNGYKEKEFRVVKFRTMTNAVDSTGKLLPNKDRLTKSGTIIRKTSLDEIPQLINVVLGQMSCIGPRPLPTRYFPYFSPEEKKRFLVRPGISGRAQVSGRNNLHWEKRLQFDIDYVAKISFSEDLSILWQTISKVLKKEDIVVDPTSTMIDFDTYKKGLRKTK